MGWDEMGGVCFIYLSFSFSFLFCCYGWWLWGLILSIVLAHDRHSSSILYICLDQSSALSIRDSTVSLSLYLSIYIYCMLCVFNGQSNRNTSKIIVLNVCQYWFTEASPIIVLLLNASSSVYNIYFYFIVIKLNLYVRW